MEILFFGDSNTWGFDPATGGRYPYEQRWTTIAARALGPDYRCVTAGLNGRTTVFDDPWKACRNGKAALDYELQTHKPLDLVTVMLGTNDLKFTTADGSAKGLDTLASMIVYANQRFSTSSPVFSACPKLLLVAPILVGAGLAADECMTDAPFQSQRLAALYAEVAHKYGAAFFNAAAVAEPSPLDGQHLTAAGHLALGQAIAAEIKKLF